MSTTVHIRNMVFVCRRRVTIARSHTRFAAAEIIRCTRAHFKEACARVRSFDNRVKIALTRPDCCTTRTHPRPKHRATGGNPRRTAVDIYMCAIQRVRRMHTHTYTHWQKD